MIKLLGLNGSVRATSSNGRLLAAAVELAAGGYPGVLKNALDWLVGTDAFVDKLFFCCSPQTPSLTQPTSRRSRQP